MILIRTLHHGKLQQSLAASSSKNSDRHSKPCKIWPLLTFLANPHLPIPHLSLCLQCLPSISL